MEGFCGGGNLRKEQVFFLLADISSGKKIWTEPENTSSVWPTFV